MSEADNAIVVPLDGSSGAEMAVPLAARLSRAYSLPVAFVHVADTEQLEGEADLDKAATIFGEYADGLAEKHGLAPGHCTVLEGAPSREILEFAEKAKFIVIASHGRGGFRATVIGSVADKVVRGSQVPIFVVPVSGAPEQGGQPILVGLDGSKTAEVGLAIARELGERLAAPVSLVRAYTFPTPATIEFGYYAPDLGESVRIAAEDYLRSVARPGEATYTVLGPADSAILETARSLGAGLVVLTSHGKGLAGRIALGSTTDRVMHALQRTLLIMPITGS